MLLYLIADIELNPADFVAELNSDEGLSEESADLCYDIRDTREQAEHDASYYRDSQVIQIDADWPGRDEDEIRGDLFLVLFDGRPKHPEMVISHDDKSA